MFDILMQARLINILVKLYLEITANDSKCQKVNLIVIIVIAVNGSFKILFTVPNSNSFFRVVMEAPYLYLLLLLFYAKTWVSIIYFHGTKKKKSIFAQN